MNVIGSRPEGWWRDRDAAMARLVDLLERFAAETGDDVTVVFERKPRPPPKSTVIQLAHPPKPGQDAGDLERGSSRPASRWPTRPSRARTPATSRSPGGWRRTRGRRRSTW